MKMQLIILTILLLSTLSCANRFDHFELEKTEVLWDQTMNVDYEFKESKFFVDRLRSTYTLSQQEFLALREVMSASLEQMGHKRVYKREEADLIVCIDHKVSGPFVMRRVGINKVWTNFQPEFNFGFFLRGVELQAAYDYLKRVRDIKTWKMHKEKFVFKHLVYLSELDIRAFDLKQNKKTHDVERAQVAWYAKVKSLGQTRDKFTHMASMLVAHDGLLGKEKIDKVQKSIYDDDSSLLNLKSLVQAEKYYQDQRNKVPLLEEFRHLSEEEFEQYYTNRERPFDITPLYRN